MASSAASIPASRVLNLSNSSLRSLIYCHLLRPAAAATSTPTPHIIKNNISNAEQLLFNPFYSERRSLDLVNPSFDMKNLNTAANLPRNLERTIGFSASKIETDRHRGPVKDEDSDDSGDSDYDDDKDDDDYDYDDDYDDDDKDNYDDDDEEGPPRRFRNYE